jgi:hypothetical protein
LLLLTLFNSGCIGVNALQVELVGTLAPDQDQGALRFDANGYPEVYERPVDLPRAQEDHRYGLVVVDSSPLPPGWRPRHAPDGGVLVAALDRASPLARAGVRSSDLILAVNGEPIDSPEQLVVALQEADRVELIGQSRWGPRPYTITAEPSDEVAGVSSFQLPAVFSVASSDTGTGVTVGPLGLLFASRAALMTNDHRYVERSEWGFLLDLFRYRSETETSTGKTKSRFTLFWFLDFGDEI